MPKSIKLSRNFLSAHARKGQQTFFVEKFLNGLGVDYKSEDYLTLLFELNSDKVDKYYRYDFLEKLFDELVACVPYTEPQSKLHTILAGNRFVDGELFQPEVWSGRPFRAPAIRIWHPLPVRVYDYKSETNNITRQQSIFLKNEIVSFERLYTKIWYNRKKVETIAENDGLGIDDFLSWFKHPSNFNGQIITWSDKINY